MTGAGYSEAVKARCREPHRAGTWPDGVAHVGTGAAGSLDDGALTRVQVQVSGDGELIEDARFTAFGCSAVVASASYIADRVVGLSPTSARGLAESEVTEALGLPADKQAMARLAVAAARAAVDDWEIRTGSGLSGRRSVPTPLSADPTSAAGAMGQGGRR